MTFSELRFSMELLGCEVENITPYGKHLELYTFRHKTQRWVATIHNDPRIPNQSISPIDERSYKEFFSIILKVIDERK